jgi:VWFA-related protein
VLERVVFYRGEQKLDELTQGPFVVRIDTSEAAPQTFVRVVATLRDGREIEDVSILEEGAYGERIDVHLVELQVLVTDRTGAAVEGLRLEDFEIEEGGEQRQPERLYPAEQVALLIGLAVDSSGSMWPLWDQTRSAALYFLDGALRPRDRAFLVDFDSRLRLMQAATGDRQELAWALERVEPHGGTALYDSMLFSLLQYEGEPGRRALIVLTDGVDSESRSDPRRAIDFGRRLGVPVYVIAISGAGGEPLPPNMRRSSRSMAAAAEEAVARTQLKLITDPTGGRLFNVVSTEQMERAFAEIQEELRRQYVLTYYTDRSPDEPASPVVRVRRQGMEVRSAVPLEF